MFKKISKNGSDLQQKAAIEFNSFKNAEVRSLGSSRRKLWGAMSQILCNLLGCPSLLGLPFQT